MPRPLRAATGGYVYHVLNRRNGRLALFEDGRDYAAFERVLQEGLNRTATRLLAYCLMPNHWHFVLWPREDGELSQFVGWVTMTHAQRWHAFRRNAGDGHLYQARFKSFPIQKDKHFQIVCRYVERNALRAGLVDRAEHWRWSSLSQRAKPKTKRPIQLTEWPVARPTNWRQLVNSPLNEQEAVALRASFTRSRPFGTRLWQTEAAGILGLDWVVGLLYGTFPVFTRSLFRFEYYMESFRKVPVVRPPIRGIRFPQAGNSGIHDLTGNAAVLKEINTVRVLNHLRQSGPASRAQLARVTGLDAKTITNVGNRLLKEGLALRRKALICGRGRPAEKLSLNPDAALAVGVDFGASQVSVVLVDLQGNLRKTRFRQEFGSPKGKAFLLKKSGAAVKELIASLERAQRRTIAGVGLSVPGLLDRSKGVVHNSVNIRGFKNVPIVDLFKKRLRCPVILEESSRAMALAEIWFGPPQFRRDFICVDLGFGIGMGVVHDGLLYRGANELSGEIGHTVVQPDGARCRCGKRGCLETVASGKALGELAKRIALKRYGISSKGAKAICEAAVAGNARAREAIEKAGESIGIAVANLINLFDPGRVILNGGLVKAGALLTEPLRRAAKKHSIRPFDKRCPIEVSELGDLAGAMGAAMLVLRSYFEFDNIRI